MCRRHSSSFSLPPLFALRFFFFTISSSHFPRCTSLEFSHLGRFSCDKMSNPAFKNGVIFADSRITRNTETIYIPNDQLAFNNCNLSENVVALPCFRQTQTCTRLFIIEHANARTSPDTTKRNLRTNACACCPTIDRLDQAIARLVFARH